MADENGKLTNQDLRILEIRNKLEKENNDTLGEQRKISSEIIDNLSNSLKGRKDVGELDKKTLKITRDISNFQEKIASSYDDIRKVRKDINKAEELSSNLARQHIALSKQANDEGIDLVKHAQEFLDQKKAAYDEEKKSLANLAAKRLAYEASLTQSVKSKQKSSKDEYNLAQDTLSVARDNIQAVEDSKGKYVSQFEAIEASKDALAEQVVYLKEQERVQKNLTTSIDKIENGLDKFGLKPLSKILGLEKLNVHMKAFRYELTEGGKHGLTGVGKLAVGFKGLGSVIQLALNPLVMITLAITAIRKLLGKVKEGYEEGLKAASTLSNENVGLARNLGLAQGAASKLAANVRGIGPTAAASVQSAEALYSAMGGTEKLSKNTLKTFIQLNTYAGMSADNLAEFHNYAKLSGKDSGVVVTNMAGAALSAIKNNKLAVSQKVLLGDVAKVSDVIKLRYQGQEKELVKIVADAKKYGLELAKAEDIASSLLNIEDSLSAEMEAELLTGKELNLEKAREAALNGDVATLQAEIAKNAGSVEEFNRLNVVQQEAYAKAVGMSRQDLAKMLKDQKSNLAVNGNLVDEQQNGIKAMESSVSLAEREENIERRKQEDSLGFFKALDPLMKKVEEAGMRIKKVFSDFFGKKLEELLSNPKIQDFINKLPENAEKMAKQVTEAIDALITFFENNPTLAKIALGTFVFGGQIAGGIMKGVGGLIAKLGGTAVKKLGQKAGLVKEDIGSSESNPSFVSAIITQDLTKAALEGKKGEQKDPVAQAMDAIVQTSATQVDEAKNVAEDAKKNNKNQSKAQANATKKAAKGIADATKKASKDIAKVNKKGAKDMADATKKAAKGIADATKKTARAQANATKKAAKDIAKATKKGASDMKKATDKLNKNVKGFGTQTKKLFNKLGSQMKGLFRDLKSAVNRIGKGAGGMLSMLGPIGMVASLALPAISAIVSGEGLGGALEAIDPTGLVGAVRSREEEVPEMANGGIVKRRKKVTAGEAGPEAIIPLTDFNAKLDRMITALEDLKKGGGVYMDTRLVGEALVVGGYKL